MANTLTTKRLRLRHPDQIFAGGAWVEPATKQVISIICPNTEKTVAHVARAVEADMDRAVAAARTGTRTRLDIAGRRLGAPGGLYDRWRSCGFEPRRFNCRR